MVFDVPAESGGALSILNDFYQEVKDCCKEQDEIEWYFVLSTTYLEERDNIKTLNYPWVKKSWLHRFYFDRFIAPKIVNKYNVDKILSLQNLVVPKIKRIPQIVYIHQSLPFVNYKFKFMNETKFWVYQNLIGKSITNSIEKANKTIVQTNWMKDAIIKKAKNVEENNIKVIPPKVDIKKIKTLNKEIYSMKTFFYPASAQYYKNHRVIVGACQKLIAEGIKDFNVIFTLNGNETEHIRSLYLKVKDKSLPISFIGRISRDEVFEYYSKCVLLFPSYIETFGMPLLEAKLTNSFIIASDAPFTHEILKDYDNVRFIDPFNNYDVSKNMKEAIKKEKYNNMESNNPITKNVTIIEQVLSSN
ncbi:glycosyltransferase [Filobacillus milosensis]|nr:glycosyltransferase [Filobacillus milosensis]